MIFPLLFSVFVFFVHLILFFSWCNATNKQTIQRTDRREGIIFRLARNTEERRKCNKQHNINVSNASVCLSVLMQHYVDVGDVNNNYHPCKANDKHFWLLARRGFWW